MQNAQPQEVEAWGSKYLFSIFIGKLVANGPALSDSYVRGVVIFAVDNRG